MGRKRQYGYDSAGRKTSEKWYAKSATTPFETMTFGYDDANNLTLAENSVASYTLDYDDLNRANVVTVSQGPAAVVQTFGYDGAGNRNFVYIENSANSAVTQIDSTYDPANRLASQTLAASVGTATREVETGFGYTVRGELEDVTRTDSASVVGGTHMVYDPSGRVSSVSHTSVAGSTPLRTFDYTYDGANRLLTASEDSLAYKVYGYSANDQLETVTVNGTVVEYDQTYDATGNRTGSTVVAGNRVTNAGLGWIYAFNDNGEMTGKSNATTGDTWTYAYDPRGQMIAADLVNSKLSDTVSVEYDYDAFGNRVGRREWDNSVLVAEQIFVVDGWDPAKAGGVGTERFDTVMDLDGSGATTEQRMFGAGYDRPLVHLDDDLDAEWYLADRQGSIRGLMDDLGTLTSQRDYAPFGAGTSPGAWSDRYSYTGREHDEALDLQYSRGRMYDLATGRWQSEDPKGQDAGDANLFRYVGNNATNMTDPSGLEDEGFFTRRLNLAKTMIAAGTEAAGNAINRVLEVAPVVPPVLSGYAQPAADNLRNSAGLISNALEAGARSRAASMDAIVRNTEDRITDEIASKLNDILLDVDVLGASAKQSRLDLEYYQAHKGDYRPIDPVGDSLDTVRPRRADLGGRIDLATKKFGHSITMGTAGSDMIEGITMPLVTGGLATAEAGAGITVNHALGRHTLADNQAGAFTMGFVEKNSVTDGFVSWRELEADLMAYMHEKSTGKIVSDKAIEKMVRRDAIDFQRAAGLEAERRDPYYRILGNKSAPFIEFGIDLAMTIAMELPAIAKLAKSAIGSIEQLFRIEKTMIRPHGRNAVFPKSMLPSEIADHGPLTSGLKGQGWKPYPAEKIDALAKYLEKRGVDLFIDETLEGGRFVYRDIDEGLLKRPLFKISSKSPTESVWHELGHFLQWKQVGGTEAYALLPRNFGNNVPEQFVYDMLKKPSRWDRLSSEYQKLSTKYLNNRFGGKTE